MAKLSPQEITNGLQTIEKKFLVMGNSFNEMCKSHKAVKFEAECQFALMAIKGNDRLMQAFLDHPESLESSLLNVAGSGISLNPIHAHAYLVPRWSPQGTKICLDVSYKGLSHLATESGSIEWVQAELVHKNDDFTMRDLGQPPMHERKPFGDRGEIIGAYCLAKTAKGDFLCTPMSVEEINEIRDNTDAYKAFLARKIKSTPWESYWGEMAKKTTIKRASKTWPKCENARIDKAIAVLNEHEGISFNNPPQLEAPPVKIDYGEREEQLKDIEQRFAALTDGMETADKMSYFSKVSGCPRWETLKRMNNDELDGVIEKLKTEALDKERAKATQETAESLDKTSPQEELGTRDVVETTAKVRETHKEMPGKVFDSGEKGPPLQETIKPKPRSVKDVTFRLDE